MKVNKLSKNNVLALTGAQAATEALRQINPAVVAAYPITPQTPIIEGFARMVAAGLVETEFIRVESEHSALSAVVGAQAAGVRAMTASSSAGLALMFEILGVASGLRLPIVMLIANRALSSPINIHCDHSDTMGVREQGWLQIYAENPQEVYDHTLLALKLAEHPEIQLPIMVCQDGFITSHAVERVATLADETVQQFIGPYQPQINLLNSQRPETIGPLALPDYQMEIKELQMGAAARALEIYPQTAKELETITGRECPAIETSNLDKADVAIVTLGSTAGTVKHTIENLKSQNSNVKTGLLKIRLFRPFPYEEVRKALQYCQQVLVLDRTPTYGAGAPLYLDVKNALYGLENPPAVESIIFGLGGRDFGPGDVEAIISSQKGVRPL